MFCSLLSLAAALVQTGQPVADINPNPPEINAGSFPSSLTAILPDVYFAAATTAAGRELWISEPDAPARLVRDISPGQGGSNPAEFTALPDGRVLFSALTPLVGTELWVTDGTTAGTQLVADLQPGSGSSFPRSLSRVGDAVLFIADGGDTGFELWRTDGTAAGTTLVRDLIAGQMGIDKFGLTGAMASRGDLAVFSVHQPVADNWRLFRTDGTPGGTSPLAQLGNVGFDTLDEIAVLGDQFFFGARGAQVGRELWRSDGTPAGTAPISDIAPGADVDSNPRDLIAAGGLMYFSATHPTTGTELYRTDGTSAGTRLVLDIAQGGLFFSSSDAAPLAALGDQLVFAAWTQGAGREPWITDGTPGGTLPLGNLSPGAGSSLQQFGDAPAATFGNKVVFGATVPAFGQEAWITDGTPGGTWLLADLAPGAGGSGVAELTASGGRLLMRADNGQSGPELFESDGTQAGTGLAADLQSNAISVGSDPSALTRVGDRMFLSADDGTHGRELWRTDGTGAGTSLVLDLYPGPNGSEPFALTPFRNRALFVARTEEFGNELWISDGTAAGTELVVDLTPGPQDSFWTSDGFAVLDSLAYFAAGDGTGNSLWRTDGTAAGTEPFFGDPTVFNFILPGSFTWNGRLYFAGIFGEPFDLVLYSSDGTVGGTLPVLDPALGGALNFSTLEGTVGLGEYVYFTAFDEQSGSELWRTDGSAAGTERVVDLAPGSASSSPQNLVALEDALFFLARDAVGALQPFATDGTAAGTRQLAPLPGVQSGAAGNGSRAVFRVSAGLGLELWSSDGTVAGTDRVALLQPEFLGAPAFEFAQAGSGDVLVFNNNDGFAGYEPWVTDGTPAGTGPAADLAPGGASSFPGPFERTGSSLLFVANDGSTGTELHRLALADLGEWVAEPFGPDGPDNGPSLGVDGIPLAGQPFELVVDSGIAAVPGLIGVGLAPAFGPPLGLGQLLVAAPLTTVLAFQSDGTGEARLDVQLPAGLVGSNFYLQAVAIVHGIELLPSRGLELVIGQ